MAVGQLWASDWPSYLESISIVLTPTKSPENPEKEHFGGREGMGLAHVSAWPTFATAIEFYGSLRMILKGKIRKIGSRPLTAPAGSTPWGWLHPICCLGSFH
jgi:hypothetical protein